MTQAFVQAYLDQLRTLRSPSQIELVYNWLWERQAEVDSVTKHINRELGLLGECQLRPTVPVFCVGPAKARLRIVGVNPAYRGNAAVVTDRYCRSSIQNYLQYTLGYFCYGPRIEGHRSAWWTKALNFLRLFPEYEHLSEMRFSPDERWQLACQDDVVGGWDIFPFWSTQDGVSRKVKSVHWLRELAISSLQAAARSGARTLLVASPEGWDLLRHGLWPSETRQDYALGEGAARVTLSCYQPADLDGNTTIVAINRQIFAGALHPGFKPILAAIKEVCG